MKRKLIPSLRSKPEISYFIQGTQRINLYKNRFLNTSPDTSVLESHLLTWRFHASILTDAVWEPNLRTKPGTQCQMTEK